MTVSVVDEALRALDRVRQQLAQERAVKAELLEALYAVQKLIAHDWSRARDVVNVAIAHAERPPT